MKRHAFLALHFLIPAALVVGCVTRKTDTDQNVNTGSSGTTSSSSGGGEGGSGGTGGGGGGGGGSCVGVEGTGQTAAACDQLNISPAQGASQQCGPNQDEDPPGYLACQESYTVFVPGSAEHFTACLGLIGVGLACEVTDAQACLDATIDASCDSQEITDACLALQTGCGTDIDQVQCRYDLRPFSNAGLTGLTDCINAADPMLSCQEAYDQCYPQVLPL